MTVRQRIRLALVLGLVLVAAAAAGAVRLAHPMARPPGSSPISREAFDAAGRGWYNAGRNLVLAKSSPMGVEQAKVFRVTTEPAVHDVS